MPENPWVDPRPFMLPAAAHADIGFGALLVHGFTGSPAEMRSTGEWLAARGITACGVLLPGHGSRHEEMDDVRAEQWLEAVSDGWAWLGERCERRAVIGLSMGALLSTVFVAGRSDVSSLVLIAPAFEVDDWRFRFTPLARWFLGSVPAPGHARAGLVSADGWKRLWHYERRSVSAAAELHRVWGWARAAAPSLRLPLLVIQGARDLSVNPAGARWVFENVASETRELVSLPDSGHCLTVDVEAERANASIERFLSAHF